MAPALSGSAGTQANPIDLGASEQRDERGQQRLDDDACDGCDERKVGLKLQPAIPWTDSGLERVFEEVPEARHDAPIRAPSARCTEPPTIVTSPDERGPDVDASITATTSPCGALDMPEPPMTPRRLRQSRPGRS
jgi:hypothetical protein